MGTTPQTVERNAAGRGGEFDATDGVLTGHAITIRYGRINVRVDMTWSRVCVIVQRAGGALA